jgi:hypothetical protein
MSWFVEGEVLLMRTLLIEASSKLLAVDISTLSTPISPLHT